MTILPQENAKQSRESVPLYVAGRAVPVAFVDPERGVLRKGIRAAHYLRKRPAIAFDEAVLVDAAAMGATRIVVTDRDDGTTFYTDMTTFRRRGYHVDRGFGDQWALELGWWEVDGRPGELAERARRQEAKDSQLSLFGGAG